MPLSNSLKDKISARLKSGDTVIVGLSGGPDSVFLTEQLLKSSLKLRIIVCHVNYRLRKKASDLDQKFVEDYCRSRRLTLEILQADKTIRKGNLENNCRRLRYNFFEKIRQKYAARMILVAHHLNDQIETFLLNLTRGSSFRGFAAMPEFDPARHLFRPLLSLSKAEILAWLEQRQIPYRLDRSNLSAKFSRNQIRLKVIPQLEKINRNFLITAGESLRDLAQSLDLIDTLAAGWLRKNLHQDGSKIYFDQEIFLVQPEIMQKILLRKISSDLHGKSLTRQTLEEILLTIRKKKAGLKKEFGPKTFLKTIKDAKKRKRLVVMERKLD
jgi:tRNA(Ile)-lysidine synthase